MTRYTRAERSESLALTFAFASVAFPIGVLTFSFVSLHWATALVALVFTVVGVAVALRVLRDIARIHSEMIDAAFVAQDINMLRLRVVLQRVMLQAIRTTGDIHRDDLNFEALHHIAEEAIADLMAGDPPQGTPDA